MVEDWKNKLYYGDNLDVMREMNSESIDLIYLDPPFNSGKNYNISMIEKDGSKSKAQVQAFEDTWSWGPSANLAYDELMTSTSELISSDIKGLIESNVKYLGKTSLAAYMVHMAPRLCEMKRLLKSTGSIYLHCDPSASHYLKMLMDAIFGFGNFRNEIVWCYTGSQNAHNYFQCKHDIILFYSKTKNYYFDSESIRIPFNITSKYYVDDEGRKYTKKYGKIYYVKHDGKIPEDYWIDINRLHHISNERLGYPTQKPESLLDRILKASCPPGGTVLDPFCGCGTTIAVAQRLGIRWVGIDITHLAINIIKKRLFDTYGDIQIELHGDPKDATSALSLASQDKYQFQWWFVDVLGGIPHKGKKKGADTGIDGVIYYSDDPKDITHMQRVIISVKGGTVGPKDIRDLVGVIKREKAAVGVIAIANNPTTDMIKEINSHPLNVWTRGSEDSVDWFKYPSIQMISVEEYFGGKRIIYPNIQTVGMYSTVK